MRRRLIAIFCLVTIVSAVPAFAYRLIYKEDLWKLYHRHLDDSSIDIAENIHWLEEALRADFANPLNAVAVIHDKTEWEKYRDLFTMHLDLKLVELYLEWGSTFNKQAAYFYNAPWQQLNLESLDKAETLFRYALVYWAEAQKYSKAADDPRFKWIQLNDIQAWEDEQFRIQTGDLDYQAIIDRHLGRLAQVRQTFKNMDGNTY